MEGTWERIGGIGIDSSTAGFGDGGIRGRLPIREWLPPERLGKSPLDTSDLGVPLLVINTGADVDLPVEVLRVGERQVAARMEFVDDVAGLDGAWEQIGSLEVSSGSCIACDPFCSTLDVYTLKFDAPNGVHPIEQYRYTYPEGNQDVLGIRVLFGRTREARR